MPRKFIILANARSGSTLLVKSLDHHPDLKIMPEVLHHQYDTMKKWRNENGLKEYEPIDNLSDYTEIFNKIYSKIDGFKIIHINKVNMNSIIDTINKNNILTIILKREDMISSVLSLKIAYSKNKWQNYDFKTDVSSENKIHVDPADFIEELEHIETFFNHTEKISGDKLYITYENMINDWNGTINTILDSIGCRHYPIPMKIGKLIHDNHSDYIDNYDKIKEYISKTRWGSILSK